MQIAAASGKQIPEDISILPPTTSARAVYAGLAQLALADMADLRELAPADLTKLSAILRFSETSAAPAAAPELRCGRRSWL